MCGRFTGLTYDEIRDVIDLLERDTGFDVWDNWSEARDGEHLGDRADSFPGNTAGIIRPGGAGGGSPVLEPALLQWGYSVAWQDGPVFNTRIESALGKRGMWSDSIEKRRCVVPTLGFFEPHATEKTISARTGRAVKRPYHFASATPGPTFLAGIWQDDRFSVMTTEPNEWVSPVHRRMPVVLRPAEVFSWLWGGLEELAAFVDRSDIALCAEPQGILYEPSIPEQLSLF